jgi:glycosyltransferase involved in cell wall biosynthesis
MKVASIFLHPFSGSLGSTVRVKELSISLAKLGVVTHIFTPYEKESLIANGVYVRSVSNVSNLAGLSRLLYSLSRFAYYNGWMLQKVLLNKKLQKTLAVNFAKNVLRKLRDTSVDIIQGEQDVAVFPCIKLKESLQIPLVLSFHNVTSEELVAAGVISRESREFEALQQSMKDALCKVDLVVVVSDEMKQYVVSEYGLNKNSIIVVPPGGRRRVKKVGDKSLSPNVVYAGLVAYRERVELFVKSMPFVKLKKPDARFYITKKGEDLKRVQGLARRFGVEPEYFWYPDEPGFYRFLGSSHVGVLPSSNDLARKMGTPVKLFDYFSVGLPVVANDVGGWTDIIKKQEVGILTGNDPADFASGILELVEDRELAEKCGRKGLWLVENEFNWDISAKKLSEGYTHLLDP